MDKQGQSRQRIADHGEVFTRQREIHAMLDLVKHETERIDSRFLEPACGTGNFLAEVLRRKLTVVEQDHAPTSRRRDQLGFEQNSVLAVSSLYGIELLGDNVLKCRQRLFDLFDEAYNRLFGSDARNACLTSVRYILSRNIVRGDALTMQTVSDEPDADPPGPIILPEWSLLLGGWLKRRDFRYEGLLEHQHLASSPLFNDLGEEAFVPTPVRDYPVVHYLHLAEHQPDPAHV